MQHGVRLSSNGDYWQAVWRDASGQPRGKSLGPKSALSRRQASLACQRLAADFALNPGRREVSRAPRLGAFVVDFLAARPHLAKGSADAYRLAGDGLGEFAGDVRLDQLTPALAGRWHTALTAQGLAAATVAQRCRHARVMLNDAVERGLVARNPFKKLPLQPAVFERHWHQVQREDFTKILAAAPNAAWRSFLALQRLGGLRRGEALKAEWRHVDWAEHTLRLPPEILKTRRTGRGRIVPLEPELYRTLLEAHAEAPAGAQHIAPREQIGTNPNRAFAELLKGLGLTPWEDLFQTLRRNAVGDLRRLLNDPWLTTSIAGHSEQVERDFYLHLRPEDVAKVTGVGVDERLGQLVAAWPLLTDEQREAIWNIVEAGS